MKKVVVLFLTACMLVATLAGCGAKDSTAGNDIPAQTDKAQDETDTNMPEPSTPSTEVIIDKIADPEDGTILDVDLTARGEIKSNAPAMNSGEFILEGATMQLPFAGSALTDKGWHFSENSSAKDELLDPESVTNLVSFYIYDANGNEMLLYQAINNSDSAKPVLECQISSFAADTFSLNETFGDLILPGGICLYSTAADVIEIFGTPENNSNFENVYVYEHGIYYVENKGSGLCYYFSFYSSEDYNGELNGHIRSVRISTDY